MKFMIPILTALFALGVADSALAGPCDAVKREMAFGQAAAEDAKDKAGFKRAAEEFNKAVRKAPGCAAAFFNLGAVQEQSGEFVAAKAAYEQYLKLSPNAPDVGKVEQQIYKLEYRIGTASTSSPWDDLAGNWCQVRYCDQPKDYFRATVQNNVLELKRKWRWGQQHGLADRYKTFRVTISPDGKLKGTYKYGSILLAHPTCTGRDFSDQYNVTGEFKKGDVMDAQGRTISGGVIIFRYREWSNHIWNYSRCTLDRPATDRWLDTTVMFRRAN